MGIKDFAIVIPAGKLDIDELGRRSGIDRENLLAVLPAGRLSTLAPGQHIWDLGRDAAVTVLGRNDVRPEDIGMVLWAGSADWGKAFWSPAAKVASEVGIHHAHCLEMSNFCNAGMAAISFAQDQVRLGRHQHVLVIVADRLSQLVDHTAGLIELFNFADSAAAVLVSAQPRYEVLASAHRTDPQWADYYYAVPTPAGEMKIERTPKRDGLGEAFTANFTALTRAVLEDIGRSAEDVTWFLVTHGNQDLHRAYLTAMGADDSRSVFNYEMDGHLGGVDPLLAIEGLQQAGQLDSGDLLVVATAGSGFTWGVTAMGVI